jgi:hypothetical protein
MVKLSYAYLLLFCAITGSSVASPLPYVSSFYKLGGSLNNVYIRITFDSRGTASVDRVQSGIVSRSYLSNELGSHLNGRDEYDRRDLLESWVILLLNPIFKLILTPPASMIWLNGSSNAAAANLRPDPCPSLRPDHYLPAPCRSPPLVTVEL